MSGDIAATSVVQGMRKGQTTLRCHHLAKTPTWDGPGPDADRYSITRQQPAGAPVGVPTDRPTNTEQEKHMTALTTFCNPDPHAVRIARELHQSENPILTVLFGSRARGDHASGRSDVDILMVQEQPPTEEQDRRVRLHAQSLAASLYRGYMVPVNVVWMPLEEFEKRRRFINDVVGRAMDHGIILSNSRTDYGARSRRARTLHHVRWARRHLDFFLDRQDQSEPNDGHVGVQAYLAIQDALMAVVYARGEWCPDIFDIDMLIDLAARADPGFNFSPAIEGEVYSQYSLPREGLSVERPLSGVINHRVRVEEDVRNALGRVETAMESWRRNGPATTAS